MHRFVITTTSIKDVKKLQAFAKADRGLVVYIEYRVSLDMPETCAPYHFNVLNLDKDASIDDRG